jgi:hypothetical protein
MGTTTLTFVFSVDIFFFIFFFKKKDKIKKKDNTNVIGKMTTDYFCDKENFIFMPICDFTMQDSWSFEDILDPRRFASVSDLNAIIRNPDIELPNEITNIHLNKLYMRDADVLSLLERIPQGELAKLRQAVADILIRYIREHNIITCPGRVFKIMHILGYPSDAMEHCVVACVASVDQYKKLYRNYFYFLGETNGSIGVLAKRCAAWMHMAIYHDNRPALVGLWSVWTDEFDIDLLQGLIVSYSETQRQQVNNYLERCLLSSLARTIHRTVNSDVKMATPVSANCNVIIRFTHGDSCRIFTCFTHDACVKNITYLNYLCEIEDEQEAKEKAYTLFLYLIGRNDDLVATFGSRDIYIQLFPHEFEHLVTINKHCVTLSV